MEWNINFLQKNILVYISICVYTCMSSYFLYSLGKKDGENKLQIRRICLVVVIFRLRQWKLLMQLIFVL